MKLTKQSSKFWVAGSQVAVGVLMMSAFFIVVPWTSVVSRSEAELAGQPLPEGWDYAFMNHGVYTQWRMGKPKDHPILYGLLWIIVGGSAVGFQILHRQPGSLTSSGSARSILFVISVAVILYAILRSC